nr:cation:proton antiporter [Bacteroidales bacterium]
MGHLPVIISDLALILIVASITTLIFKYLKQPVVLGYIVAGMIVGPLMSMLPTVQDTSNVQIWADIGVLFLLFALGLEFSFKKLIAVGKTGIITACVEVFSLLIIGYIVGMLLGWGHMNSIFLGAMLSMSSTTIIIKAFEDLNIKRKKFTGLVFGALVVEDLLAIVMMVLLSTLAVSAEFSGWDMLTAVFKLIFFLALWFIAGVYLIPSLLQKTRKHLNDETLLVVSVGLCLSMVVLAVKVGFSSALGAFIMGSILAETIEAVRIEKLIKPLKDLFGAVFFVSVGMMVDIKVLADYVWPIIILIFVVLILKMMASTFGMMLSGQSLKVSVQSGFSLAQIGEFAFIIASLGMSLGVTSSFLYPVAVAVSVVTTFMTPYMIKLSGPCYLFLEKHLPEKFRAWLKRRSLDASVPKSSKVLYDWVQLLKQYTVNLLLMLIINLGIILLSLKFLEPFLLSKIPEGPWAGIICSVITLLVMSPFLKSLMSNRRKTSGHMMNLWTMNAYNRFIILALTALRLILACGLVVYVLMHALALSRWIVLPMAIVLIFIILKSKTLMRHYWQLESAFVINLNERQMQENHERIQENMGVRHSNDMGDASWLDRILYAYSMQVGENSFLIDKSLEEADFRSSHNLIVIRAQRQGECVNIPGRDYVIKAGDILTFAGKNKTMTLLNESVWDFRFVQDSLFTLHHFSQMEMQSGKDHLHLCCAGFPLSDKSLLANKTLKEAQIGRNQKCLVLGVERKGKQHINPSSSFQILPGDIVWVLGEESFVSKLISINVYGMR